MPPPWRRARPGAGHGRRDPPPDRGISRRSLRRSPVRPRKKAPASGAPFALSWICVRLRPSRGGARRPCRQWPRAASSPPPEAAREPRAAGWGAIARRCREDAEIGKPVGVHIPFSGCCALIHQVKGRAAARVRRATLEGKGNKRVRWPASHRPRPLRSRTGHRSAIVGRDAETGELQDRVSAFGLRLPEVGRVQNVPSLAHAEHVDVAVLRIAAPGRSDRVSGDAGCLTLNEIADTGQTAAAGRGAGHARRCDSQSKSNSAPFNLFFDHVFPLTRKSDDRQRRRLCRCLSRSTDRNRSSRLSVNSITVTILPKSDNCV
jgi:hypothetical protein